MNKNSILLLVGIALVPVGCTMAPKYTRPAAPVSDAWPTGAAYAKTQEATSTPQAPDLSWREFFTDEKLQQVIDTALTNNRDLRVAALRVEQARTLYGIQRAELLPTVNATGSGSKQRVPADLSATRKSQTTDRYDVNLGVASWEIDFFGRIHSLKDNALEEYLATEQAHRSAQILLVASVANAYLTLAADRENFQLARSTLDTQQTTYDLIRRRYDVGLVPELDLRQAQTRVEAARVNVVFYTQRAAQDENALNLLAGSPVPSGLLPAALSSVRPPQEVAPGASSEVLLRRPDILAAEGRLKAANANIGAARAAFFPRISLTTAWGTASGELSGLFQSGSEAWSFSPKIVVPIFDARTWSALKATKAEREIILTLYEKSIQTAFREVADALAIRGTVDEQLSAQQSLVHATAETYRLSQLRYTKGIDSFLGVIDAQRSLYTAQQELVALRLAKLANQVRLYAVLGGGGNSLERTEP